MKKQVRSMVLVLVALLCTIAFSFGNKYYDTADDFSDAQDIGAWVTTLAPGCETEGIQTRADKNDPSVIETRTIAALGHSWGTWTQTTAPTCLITGVESRTCSDCGNIDVRSIAVLGHDWGEAEIITEPSCLVSGTARVVCKHDAAHIEMFIIDELGHDWSEWTVSIAPNCIASGVETRICKNNNSHTDMRSISALNHQWSEWVVSSAPTCTQKGTEIRLCQHDNAHIETRNTLSALGHDWSEWVATTPPTDVLDGEETRICRNGCGGAETRIAYATGTLGLAFTLNEDGNSYAVSKGTVFIDENGDDRGTWSHVNIPAYHNRLPVTHIATNGFSPSFTGGGLPSITLPETLTHIGFQAFTFNGRLQNITIPKSVISIGENAFHNAKGLQSITFEQGSQLQSIGAFAFHYATSLTSVVLPKSITNIDRTIFSYCSNLKSISFDGENSVYKIDCNAIIRKSDNVLQDGTVATAIPDYVKAIEARAFLGCGGNVIGIENGEIVTNAGFENLIIPSSVKLIGERAFAGPNYKLKSVIMQEGVERIEEDAFDNCRNLQILVIPSTIKFIAEGTFDQCDKLTDVYYGGSSLAEWEEVETFRAFGYTKNPTIYYYSETPIYDGEHWRFVDDMPQLWIL